VNGHIWKAQPKWIRIIQAPLVFFAIGIFAYTLIFDQDDPGHHVLLAVGILAVVGLLQLGFFLLAVSRGDL
jgi:hypothetical protein